MAKIENQLLAETLTEVSDSAIENIIHSKNLYLDALESASVGKNIIPFVEFILDTINNDKK